MATLPTSLGVCESEGVAIGFVPKCLERHINGDTGFAEDVNIEL